MTFRLQLITSEAFADDVLVARAQAIAAALPRGAVAIQVRDRFRPVHEVKKLVERMARVSDQTGAMLIVNRLGDVAREFGAGLHLGKPDATTASAVVRARNLGIPWLSLSAHTDDEVQVAVDLGAAAALVSPIFMTQSGAATDGAGEVMRKSERGLIALQRAIAIAEGRLACVALGGIDTGNAAACFAAGASAVAMLSQWLEISIDKFVGDWRKV